MSTSNPPRLATWVLKRLTTGPTHESLIGDLEEQFRSGRSRWWYWRQVVWAVVATLLAEAGMRTRLVVAAQLAFIFPPALFMTAVVARNLPYAHNAQRLVMWYVQLGKFGLWGLLISLPMTVLVAGCATLLRTRSHTIESQDGTGVIMRKDRATRFIAGTTLTAGGILVVVILHMLAN